MYLQIMKYMKFQKNHISFYLHGDESYVECNNTIDITKDFTFTLHLRPDDIILTTIKTLMNIVYLVFQVGIQR